MIEIVIFFLVTLALTYVSNKINLLPNFSGEKHQLFINEKKIPLIGGILLLLISNYIFYDKNLFFCIGSLLVFIIGFLSDTKILISPKIRILLQFLIVFFMSYILDIRVSSTRIEYLDKFIEVKFFGILFSVFCIMILLNGANFIDGLNGLLLGYVIIVILLLLKLNLLKGFDFNNEELFFLFISLMILLIFNYLNLFYLGDSGSYLSGIILGYILISVYNYNNYISPFFVILLLWYPCFENLFSIIRKNNFNKSPVIADNKHLHQLIFYFFKKKFFAKNIISNNFSSLLINLYNLIIMFIAASNISSSKFQILLISLNIVVYLIIYKILFNFRFIKK